MLRRKLIALDHPNPEEFNEADEAEFRSAVIWLEDQKIRHYTVKDRNALRSLSDPDWNKTFDKYQEELGSPVIKGSPVDQLEWLASFAIRLEYSDNAGKYNERIAAMKGKKASIIPKVVSADPLDCLDFSSAEFTKGVDKAAMLCCVGPHPDSRVRLSALATVLKNSPHPHVTGQNTETAETIDDVLNLLFISELRSLQTSINEALVAVQKITANPKTDTKLGKVGF